LKATSSVGRRLFGAAAFAFGLIALTWHEYNGWRLPRDVWSVPGGLIFLYAAAGALMFGGVAMQFRPVAKAGAAAVGTAFFVFTVVCVSRIVAAPRVYDLWGNFFEQFSLVLGAVFAYASVSPLRKPESAVRIGGFAFGTCAVSFAVEQAIHPNFTAGLVPKWLPPSQMFWSIATTIAFALAAVALLTNRIALLAARLLTAMVVSFGLFVWVPMLVSDVHRHDNSSEATETFAIAAAAWMLADLLGNTRRGANGTPRESNAAT
jgi:hypothetical protein